MRRITSFPTVRMTRWLFSTVTFVLLRYEKLSKSRAAHETYTRPELIEQREIDSKEQLPFRSLGEDRGKHIAKSHVNFVRLSLDCIESIIEA